MADSENNTVSLTAQIVSAHISHNAVSAEQLPDLIKSVYSALIATTVPVPAVVEQTPAVPIRQSVGTDHISCLCCGKKFSMLKRHLNTDHQLTPQTYRELFKLPRDYPMVAPTYARVRSALAKKIGLGRKGGRPAAAIPARRGRPKKRA